MDLVNDAWTEIFRDLKTMAPIGEKQDTSAEAEFMAEVADFRKMNRIRARVDDVVADAEIAEALKPWYRQFCKRPTFNDDYLDTFNRPNVTLVDTSPSHGVERITEHAVVANGVEYEVDCIIYATGFEIGTAPRRRIDFDIRGAGRSVPVRLLGQGRAHPPRPLHDEGSRTGSSSASARTACRST